MVYFVNEVYVIAIENNINNNDTIENIQVDNNDNDYDNITNIEKDEKKVKIAPGAKVSSKG